MKTKTKTPKPPLRAWDASDERRPVEPAELYPVAWVERLRAYILRDARNYKRRGLDWRYDECMRLVRRPRGKRGTDRIYKLADKTRKRVSGYSLDKRRELSRRAKATIEDAILAATKPFKGGAK